MSPEEITIQKTFTVFSITRGTRFEEFVDRAGEKSDKEVDTHMVRFIADGKSEYDTESSSITLHMTYQMARTFRLGDQVNVTLTPTG